MPSSWFGTSCARCGKDMKGDTIGLPTIFRNHMIAEHGLTVEQARALPWGEMSK